MDDIPRRAAPSAVFTHAVKVRWADCDPADIAYTGRIPNFALEAIEEWWDAAIGLDWYRINLDRRIGTPFVHMSIDFRSPVTPRHPLLCAVRLIRLGETSVRFSVHGTQDGVLCFEGEFVEVFVAAEAHRVIAPPADIRAKLEALLQGGA